MYSVQSICKGHDSQEEFEDVDLHQQHRNQHGITDKAKGLVLLHCKAKDPHSPSHHSHSAVGPCLQVKALTYPGIQLHSCTQHSLSATLQLPRLLVHRTAFLQHCNCQSYRGIGLQHCKQNSLSATLPLHKDITASPCKDVH